MSKDSNEQQSKKDIATIPSATKYDRVHTASKVLLSFIPYGSGSAAEIFNAIIVPPLSKRRDEWIQSIAERLIAVEEVVEGFKIENLSENEIFITVLTNASQSAIRNHQHEKLQALRNAAINSAISTTIAEDIQLMFISFIDSFTVWHIKLLIFLDNPEDWGKKYGIKYPDWSMGGLSTIIEFTFPELKAMKEFTRQVVKDLYNRGLIGTDSIGTTMTRHGMFESRTTVFGKQFVSFILSSELQSS